MPVKAAKRSVMAIGRFLVAQGTAHARFRVGSEVIKREIRADIAAIGLEIERVLKHRGDSKAVVLCRHPAFGLCVFKGYPAHAHRRLARAHTGAARLMAERSGSLLPTIFEIGDHYSLEEYVPGVMLSQLQPQAWERVDLPRFIDTVRDFGRDAAFAEAHMADGTRVRIVDYYLRKSLNDVGMGPPRMQAAVVRRLLLEHGKLRQVFRDVLDNGTTALPVGWTTNDLNTRNIIVREDTGDLVVVDAEDLGEGHFMFDLTWFLAHAARLNIRPDCLEEAYHHMFRVEVCGAETNASFFRRLLTFFLEMNALRRPSDATRFLLSLTSSDR